MFGQYGELLGSGGKQGEAQSMVLAGPAASPGLPRSSSLFSSDRHQPGRPAKARHGRRWKGSYSSEGKQLWEKWERLIRVIACLLTLGNSARGEVLPHLP